MYLKPLNCVSISRLQIFFGESLLIAIWCLRVKVWRPKPEIRWKYLYLKLIQLHDNNKEI